MIRSFFRYLLAGIFLLAACKKDDDNNKHVAGAPVSVESFLPAQGGGGTSILINGENFGDTTEVEVSINGKPLKVVGSNTKQIMAVVPRKCGSGKVVVKVGGKEVSSDAEFNYIFTRSVTTLAGNGVAGFANGKGEDAMFRFNSEGWYRGSGIAVDDDLNVYVADPGNHCIRKIDSTGKVSTLAGNIAEGDNDGTGAEARFRIPYGVAVDEQGNVYTADPGSWKIKKITPEGVVTTWLDAGGETWQVAVDKSSGEVFYANSGGGAIYRSPSEGMKILVADGINVPGGLDLDKEGNLYVAVSNSHVITRYTKGTWAPTVIAGQMDAPGYVNGTGTAAKFSVPWGLAVDADGNIYVAGNGTWDGGAYNPDQSIRFITPGNWNVSTYAGSGTSGYANAIGEAAAFAGPLGVAVDKNGTVYVLDKNNNRVRKIVSE
ncbi:IPT/TIG domain-containing protein [Chitinophaga sp. GCM10012297]|uniref:IPT/TIG domain-containing protein n=1 Tax=Chitinophaga chungangae TaxID=2821488 RepID=A0ABS3Y850_9BACT|nr:IPT/TIG domain-containing protein [Chitinophaga chungangae]MBO9150806.1 IPT/TIG domain-containing protein [Chitinophaga chungangae]